MTRQFGAIGSVRVFFEVIPGDQEVFYSYSDIGIFLCFNAHTRSCETAADVK